MLSFPGSNVEKDGYDLVSLVRQRLLRIYDIYVEM